MNQIKKIFFSLLVVGSVIAGTVPTFAKDTSPALDLARQLNQAFIEVADKVSPAVVVITVTQKADSRSDEQGDDSWWDMMPKEFRRYFEDRGQTPRGDGQTPRGGNRGRRFQHPPAVGRGSGIVITEDGYILTNNHVVENGDKIKVRFKDSKEYDAVVKGTDPESDIAVIKIKASGLVTAKLGDSDKTKVGEFAVAIGAPFDLSYSVTVGHVSAKGRSFEGYTGGYADQDFIQTDASINPGNSGGPLVNLFGEVIGINSMIRGMNTGIGFAVPINLAKRVSDHLIKEGKFVRSWIGVRIGELAQDTEFRSLVPQDVEDGVVIHQVEPNGPASKSDLKPSDVVVAVDGKQVKTARELKDQISTKKVGQTVTLDVVRGNKHVPVKIKTEALPGEEGTEKTSHKTSGEAETSSYGLTVKSLNKELADQFGVEMTSGVIVTAVEQNSPADEKGIKPGDIITEINRKPVTNPKQFRDALKGIDSKKGTIVNLISGGSSRFVILKESGE